MLFQIIVLTLLSLAFILYKTRKYQNAMHPYSQTNAQIMANVEKAK